MGTNIQNSCLCNSGNKVSCAWGEPRDEIAPSISARVRLIEQSSGGVQPNSLTRRSSHNKGLSLSAHATGFLQQQNCPVDNRSYELASSGRQFCLWSHRMVCLIEQKKKVYNSLKGKEELKDSQVAATLSNSRLLFSGKKKNRIKHYFTRQENVS